MDSQLPAIHAVITQAISALSESDREHLLSSLTTIRVGPTAVEVSTVNDLTGRIHNIRPPDCDNSCREQTWVIRCSPPSDTIARPDPRLCASSAVRDDESAGHTGIRVQVPPIGH
jgi:hypothetical protein